MADILEHLFNRNVAWAKAKTRNDPNFFRRLAVQQAPKYLWIGCSDSRVPANDVLGLDPGEVFVHRNIANVVHTNDMNILSVLEYAVDYLRVEHVIICGHYGCGGVKRALAAERGSMLDHWLQSISMFHRQHCATFQCLPSDGERLDVMCELNVEMQLRRIAATPIIEAAWARGQKIALHGWIYAIEDGILHDLDTPVASIVDRDLLPSLEARLAERVAVAERTPEPV